MPLDDDTGIAARLQRTIDAHGGVGALASATGITRQTVYKAMKTGRSLLAVRAVAEAWPDVDAHWLLTGKPR